MSNIKFQILNYKCCWCRNISKNILNIKYKIKIVEKCCCRIITGWEEVVGESKFREHNGGVSLLLFWPAKQISYITSQILWTIFHILEYHISKVKYHELYFIYLNIIYHKSNIMSHICHFLDFLDIIWGGSVPNVWPKDSFDIERRKVWLENSKSLAKKSFSWLNWTWSRFTALVIHQWNNLIIEGNQIESFSSK